MAKQRCTHEIYTKAKQRCKQRQWDIYKGKTKM